MELSTWSTRSGAPCGLLCPAPNPQAGPGHGLLCLGGVRMAECFCRAVCVPFKCGCGFRGHISMGIWVRGQEMGMVGIPVSPGCCSSLLEIVCICLSSCRNISVHAGIWHLLLSVHGEGPQQVFISLSEAGEQGVFLCCFLARTFL